MENLLFKKILKIFVWILITLVGVFILIIIWRFFDNQKSAKIQTEVDKIHSTRLTLESVLGKNLPKDPGTLKDSTVEGIDANSNGIRDDVELAIFEKYPNSEKTRAVLLQYALTLQKELSLTSFNERLANAIAEEESRAYDCIGKIVPNSEDDLTIIDNYRNFIKKIQINTIERTKKIEEFNRSVKSFELGGGCDIDLLKLKN